MRATVPPATLPANQLLRDEGLCLYALQRYQDSVEVLRSYLAVDPAAPDVAVVKGLILKMQENLAGGQIATTSTSSDVTSSSSRVEDDESASSAAARAWDASSNSSKGSDSSIREGSDGSIREGSDGSSRSSRDEEDGPAVSAAGDCEGVSGKGMSGSTSICTSSSSSGRDEDDMRSATSTAGASGDVGKHREGDFASRSSPLEERGAAGLGVRGAAESTSSSAASLSSSSSSEKGGEPPPLTLDLAANAGDSGSSDMTSSSSSHCGENHCGGHPNGQESSSPGGITSGGSSSDRRDEGQVIEAQHDGHVASSSSGSNNGEGLGDAGVQLG